MIRNGLNMLSIVRMLTFPPAFFFAIIVGGSWTLETKSRERMSPNPAMAVCTQKMIRQLAKVTMIPPIQGPIPSAYTHILLNGGYTDSRPGNTPNHKKAHGRPSNNLS